VLAVAVFTALYMAGFGVDASRYDRAIVGSVQPGSPAEAASLQPGDEILAIAVFTGLFMIGYGVDAVLRDRPVIGVVQPGSPAEAAGLQAGDEILAIDGAPKKDWEDALVAIAIRPDRAIQLRVRRGAEEKDFSVRSTVVAQGAGQIGVSPLVRVGQLVPGGAAQRAGIKTDDGILTVAGKPVTSFGDIPTLLGAQPAGPVAIRLLRDGAILDMIVTPESGKIGIYNKTIDRKLGLFPAIKEATAATSNLVRQTFQILGGLITASISPKAALAGPLGIAKASGDAARSDAPIAQLMFLVATLSVSVGILNLFPLPPLDGGHLAVLAAEGTIRRDLSLRAKTWIMNAGAIVLFLLIGLVHYSDLSKTIQLQNYIT
jgi:regulator of sigma E protease